jgi:uncharacterized protein with PIN domain
MTEKVSTSALRQQITERFTRKLDKYLPESGQLRPWTISEIEQELLKDSMEIARDVLEARIQVDPLRVPAEKPRCPRCDRALMGLRDQATHKQTIFGPIRFERSHGYCRSCGAAFSPSGHVVEVRRGLL